ncbi:MAG: hypothetical protein HZB39_20025 [Planctomycetes bacterium]|nr:hypothetical protein [Planctomycetota bacterium]
MTNFAPVADSLRRAFGRDGFFRLLALALAAFAMAAGPKAQDRDCVTIRSGPFQDITATVGGPGAPLPAFTPASFTAAAASTFALSQVFPLPGFWLPSLTGDPQAKWMGITALGIGQSFLLSHPFVLDGCVFANASITIDIAVASQAGDVGAGGPNPIGVYLNGNALVGFSGGGSAFASTWTASNIGAFLLPGCNTLEIYVRNTDYQHSGVIYSANLCWDHECLAKEYIGLHTGNGTGTVDTEVHALPLSAAPIGPDFVAAQSAPFAAITAPPPNGCLPRCNPNARWNATSGSATLYAQPFEITACNVTSLRIKGEGGVYKFLGDAANQVAGIYVNGKAVPGSWADGLSGTACLSGDFIALVGDCDLIANGTNWLYLYVREGVPVLPAPMTGLVYCARLTVTSCAQPETVHFFSGPGVMMRTGAAMTQLQTSAFVWPLDFVCSAPAFVVGARNGWCPGLSGSPAQWVAATATRTPMSTMFCQTFTVNTCTGSIGTALMTMNYAVDDDLGDFRGGGFNLPGIYINGKAVPNSMTTSGGPSLCRSMVRNVSDLLVNGPNTFTVYCRDTQAVASGAIWDVIIDIQPCPDPAIRVGDGCLPTLATLAVAAPFDIGTTGVFDVEYPQGPGTRLVILGLGFFQIPPVDLTPFGMPNCTLDIDFATTFIGMTGFSGGAQFPISVPADPALIDVPLFAQGIVRDPSVGGLGLVMTPAIKTVIR